jgi:hypothetical protein
MDHFAGLDVSVKETSICIVDETGRIVGEVKVSSEPEALLQVLMNPAYHFKRVGLEAGPLSQWLFSALGEAGLPVICVETRHMQAVLKAQINKTDRNDARGIAQMMRVGLYRPVHVKTLRSQKLRMLLTHRKLLQSRREFLKGSVISAVVRYSRVRTEEFTVVGADRPPLRFFTIFCPRFNTTGELSVFSSLVSIGVVGTAWPTLARSEPTRAGSAGRSAQEP